MIFKIAATIAILGWIFGNIGWHIVRVPYTPDLDAREKLFAIIIAGATANGVVAIIALVWGI